MGIPSDSWRAFAFFISKCASGFGEELVKSGKTDTEARNIVIGCLLAFAAGEACRIARREGREPDHDKWTTAVNDAFERAIKRTTEPGGLEIVLLEVDLPAHETKEG